MSEVTVGQAAKTVGVPVEVLRELCVAQTVPARQGERGHWYLNPDDIPSREWVLEAMRRQYRKDVAGAQEAMARLVKEVQAVQLDLNEAAEDATGRGRLGSDLRSFQTTDSPFNVAQHSLILRLMEVQRTHRWLQATDETPAP